MSIELKPCPFCGDTPGENSHALTDGGFKYGAIQCGCGALGPDVRTGYKDWPHWRDAAVTEWNTRAPSPAGVDGLEVLLPALRQYMHNDGSGLLAGYDRGMTECVVAGLQAAIAAERARVVELETRLHQLDAGNTKLHVLWTAEVRKSDKLADLLRDERMAGNLRISCQAGISDHCTCHMCRADRIDAALAELQPQAHSGS